MASPWVEFSEAEALVAGATGVLSFTLVDTADAPINGAAVSAIVGTLLDVGRGGTGQVINGREGVNLNGANGGVMAGSTFTLTLGPADTALVRGTTPRDYQRRLALLTFTYTNGTAVIPVSFWVRDPVASTAR